MKPKLDTKLDTRKGKIRIDGCEIAIRTRYITIYSCGRKTQINEISLYNKIVDSVEKYGFELREIRDYVVKGDNELINEIVEEIVYHISSHNDDNEFRQISDSIVDVEFRGFDKGIDVLEHDINLDEYEFNNIVINTIKKINAKAIWGIMPFRKYIANLFVKTNRKIYYPKFDAVSNELFVSLYYNLDERYLGLYIQRIALLEVSTMAYTCKRDRLNCVFYRYP